MAKIRPVHPDIWTDDDFVSVSPWARLLFIGLWNFACDNGHLEDRSRQIKRRVLPFDDEASRVTVVVGPRDLRGPTCAGRTLRCHGCHRAIAKCGCG